jgi:hypothetical protein
MTRWQRSFIEEVGSGPFVNSHALTGLTYTQEATTAIVYTKIVTGAPNIASPTPHDRLRPNLIVLSQQAVSANRIPAGY